MTFGKFHLDLIGLSQVILAVGTVIGIFLSRKNLKGPTKEKTHGKEPEKPAP